MSKQCQRYDAGPVRQFDPAHAGRLHSELAKTIDRFVNKYAETLN